MAAAGRLDRGLDAGRLDRGLDADSGRVRGDGTAEFRGKAVLTVPPPSWKG